MRYTLLFSLVLFSALTSFTQTPIVKGDWVIPKFDSEIAPFDKFKAWQGRMESSITVSQVTPGVIALNSSAKWRDRAFPDLAAYRISDIKQSNNKPSEVVLVTDATTPIAKYGNAELRTQIKLLIAPELDLQKVLSDLLFKGTRSEFLMSDYLSTLINDFLPKIFKGSLATLPIEQQKKLIIWSNLKMDVFGEAVFKDKKFFSVTTSEDVVYNTIQLNQAERTARQTEKSLKNLREIYAITAKIQSFDGIKLATTISSYDFVRKDDRHDEKFEMFITFDLLKMFIDADITNQELIDGSTILLDGAE